MAKRTDKNGIRVIRGNIEEMFSEVTKTKKTAYKFKNEEIDNDLLAIELKAARRAARAERVAAESAARAAAREENVKNSEKFLSYMRGLMFGAEEIEDVINPTSVEMPQFEVAEDEVERLYQLALHHAEEHGDLFEFSKKEMKEYGISNICIRAYIRAYGERYTLEGVSLQSFKNTIEREVATFAREAGRAEALEEVGLVRTNLLRHYNVSPEAFLYAEEAMRKAGSKAEWDSYGVWGLNPSNISRAWYAQGCKLGDKFRYYVTAYARHFAKHKRADYFHMEVPRAKESFKEYLGRVKNQNLIWKYSLSFYSSSCSGDSANRVVRKNALSIGDRKRAERLKSAVAKYYALKHCIVETDTLLDENSSGRVSRLTYKSEINWAKLSSWLAMPKSQRAEELPFSLAWELLFRRQAPIGLGDKDPNPVYLLDRVTQKTFRKIMEVVKSDSGDDVSALRANTKAAYHLAVIFRDIQSLNRWVSKVTSCGKTPTAIDMHDAYIDAKTIIELEHKAGWLKMLAQFPDLRWKVDFFREFEKEFKRLPLGKREFEDFASTLKYKGVENKSVAQVCAKFDLGQSRFEDYQEFFKKHGPKTATMLPSVEVVNGEYKFIKMDDHDIEGPFLGLATDCCQHLHSAGNSCAKAGWKDQESGFYVVLKGSNIVAQSWAWRGKDGTLCFDSIEGLGGVNVDTIAHLYQAAAKKLLGNLGITRVTVGDTGYGHTPRIRKILAGEDCKKSKMIKDVSYTDADRQWLLAE